MRFRGLFIGIDRHASPAVNQLSFAKRDAMALYALFSDTLGEGGALLTDAQATRASIEACLADLSKASEDDFVVITFSGHGSETHELVTHDADPNSLAASCIPLSVLTEWFNRIPAKRLIFILDCCFSGEMGAKVLSVDSKPRQISSAENLLEKLSGEGRLILTASTSTEAAWENNKLGHGLLTYFLLEALQGAEEVRQAGKVSVYRLLEHVTQRVIENSKLLGKLQRPCLRGKLDGEMTWPIFKPGPRFQTLFPGLTPRPVSSDLQSLKDYGFPPGLLNAWAGAIPWGVPRGLDSFKALLR